MQHLTDVEKITFDSERQLVAELERDANKNLRDGQAQIDFINARAWFEHKYKCRFISPKENCR